MRMKKTVTMMMMRTQSQTHRKHPNSFPWLPVPTQMMLTDGEMDLTRNLLTSAKKRRSGRIVTGRDVCWWRWMRDHRSGGTVRVF